MACLDHCLSFLWQYWYYSMTSCGTTNICLKVNSKGNTLNRLFLASNQCYFKFAQKGFSTYCLKIFCSRMHPVSSCHSCVMLVCSFASVSRNQSSAITQTTWGIGNVEEIRCLHSSFPVPHVTTFSGDFLPHNYNPSQIKY